MIALLITAIVVAAALWLGRAASDAIDAAEREHMADMREEAARTHEHER